MVTADTIDRIPYDTLRNPAMHMGLILAGWNLLVLAGGFYVALLFTAGVVAAFQAIRKRRSAPTRAPEHDLDPPTRSVAAAASNEQD